MCYDDDFLLLLVHGDCAFVLVNKLIDDVLYYY